MPAVRYGHTTEVQPGGYHPVVIVSERTPLLRSISSVETVTPPSPPPAPPSPPPKRPEQEEETTVIAEEVPFAKLVLILGAAWVGVFLGAVDSTIIATLSAPIASDFDSLSLLSWLATAYLISNAACQPISGRLSDIFGRGPCLVFSNVLFAAGNLICGVAQSSGVMIFGRVVAGIGGGGLMSISTFLSSDLIPLRKRGIVQGLGNICYGAGAMVGGVFGGLINDHTSMGWRLAFLIQVPPTLISAGLVAWLVKVPPKQSSKSLISRIDFVGVFLTISALVLALLGLNAGGNLVPWLHPLPLITLPLSVALFAAFFWWESKVKQPIIPVRLLVDRTVLSACLSNFLGTMVVMCGIFYVPLFLQVRGDSATMAGVKMLTSPIGISIGSIGAGYIMTRTGRYVSLGISSVVVLILGIFLFVLQNEDSPGWFTMLAFFFVGGGYGAMLTITLLACIAAVEHSQQAVITSATYLARSIGSTLGITVGSAVYQNILVSRLWKRFGDEPDAAEIIRHIRNNLGELKHLPEGWYDGVMKSFMESFRGVWLTLLAISIAALISVSLMRQHVLHSTLSRE